MTKWLMVAALLAMLMGSLASLGEADSRPTCSSAASDPDGDGWGFENGVSCVVAVASSAPASGADRPFCLSAESDPDGDGWGFENGVSCIVGDTASSNADATSNATATSGADEASQVWLGPYERGVIAWAADLLGVQYSGGSSGSFATGFAGGGGELGDHDGDGLDDLEDPDWWRDEHGIDMPDDPALQNVGDWLLTWFVAPVGVAVDVVDATNAAREGDFETAAAVVALAVLPGRAVDALSDHWSPGVISGGSRPGSGPDPDTGSGGSSNSDGPSNSGGAIRTPTYPGMKRLDIPRRPTFAFTEELGCGGTGCVYVVDGLVVKVPHQEMFDRAISAEAAGDIARDAVEHHERLRDRLGDVVAQYRLVDDLQLDASGRSIPLLETDRLDPNLRNWEELDDYTRSVARPNIERLLAEAEDHLGDSALVDESFGNFGFDRFGNIEVWFDATLPRRQLRDAPRVRPVPGQPGVTADGDSTADLLGTGGTLVSELLGTTASAASESGSSSGDDADADSDADTEGEAASGGAVAGVQGDQHPPASSDSDAVESEPAASTEPVDTEPASTEPVAGEPDDTDAGDTDPVDDAPSDDGSENSDLNVPLTGTGVPNPFDHDLDGVLNVDDPEFAMLYGADSAGGSGNRFDVDGDGILNGDDPDYGITPDPSLGPEDDHDGDGIHNMFDSDLPEGDVVVETVVVAPTPTPTPVVPPNSTQDETPLPGGGGVAPTTVDQKCPC
jgi:hypothetical protein